MIRYVTGTRILTETTSYLLLNKDVNPGDTIEIVFNENIKVPESSIRFLIPGPIQIIDSKYNTIRSDGFKNDGVYYATDVQYKGKVITQITPGSTPPLKVNKFQVLSIEPFVRPQSIPNTINIGGINMSCCKQFQKSAQQAYNNTAQAYTATGTTINVLGAQCTDTGCSVDTLTNGFQIENGGLYYISFDVTSTPGAAGAQILQLYKDGTALPCAITTDTTISGSILTQHIETTLVFQTCCNIQPIITARLSGVAGTVNFVRATIVKLA